MVQLRKYGMYHSDVKPDKVFLEDVPGGGERAVLGDFGMVNQLLKDMTPYIDPPEMLMKQDPTEQLCLFAMDVYELGVTLWAVHYMRYNLTKDQQQVDPLEASNRCQDAPLLVKTVLLGLLDVNPRTRWSAATLVMWNNVGERRIHDTVLQPIMSAATNGKYVHIC